jgi:hypothetical protein
MNNGDKIYLKPVGGLCNRMRAIDSGVSLAGQFNKRLVVSWERDYHLNYKYSDLFKPSEHFDTIEEPYWFGKKSLYPYLPRTKPVTPVRDSTHGVQEALIDLYCLSKARKVLGSYLSSFSQVASEISGIEEIIVY